MSYDNLKPMPSSSTHGRVARAEEKNDCQEAEPKQLSSVNGHGQHDSDVSSQQQGGESGSGSSPSRGSGSGSSSGGRRGPNSDDMDGVSSGNDSGERESEGGMEREAHGRESTRSSHSSSNGKDSGMMLETTESNKR